MSQSNNKIELDLGCDHLLRDPNKKRELKSLQPPQPVKVDLNCGPIPNSYSPVGIVYDIQPNSVSSSIFTQKSATMINQRPLIVGPPTNIETVFRIKNMRSSSNEEISDERSILRSRLINVDFPLEEKNYDPLLYGKENHFVQDIESILLKHFHERNNKTRPLFESNRLLPSLFVQGMNDEVRSKRCYRIAFPSCSSQAIPLND